MDGKLGQACDNFIEGAGHLSSTMGFRRSMGQIYALLFLSNKPLCLDDIVERLKISKGGASVNMRELENWGAVRKIWVKGSRKDFYEAELDIWKIITSKFQQALRRRAEIALGMVDNTERLIQEAEGNLSEEDKEVARVFLERLGKVKELGDLAQDLLGSYLEQIK